MNNVTVNGMPVEEWLIQHEEEKETKEIQKEATNIPRYMKPVKTYPVKKEKNDSVRYLTEDEIRKEYGMESTGKMSNTQKILWTMMNMDENGLLAKEIFKVSQASNQSLSGLLSSVWRRVGNEEGGAGLFIRVREKDGNRRSYRYYKNTDFSNLTFKDVVEIYYKYAPVKQKKKKQLGEGPAGQKLKEQIEQQAPEEQIKQQTVTTTLEEAKPYIPENVKVEVNVTYKFLFGWVKDNN